jgi:hypothetical protein
MMATSNDGILQGDALKVQSLLQHVTHSCM